MFCTLREGSEKATREKATPGRPRSGDFETDWPIAVRQAALTDLRAHLSARLLERRAEIEAATQVRIYAVSDPGETGDPTYVEGLRAALSAAFDYALAGLEGDGGDQVPIPAVLLVQARLAARNGVSLDTVLRRYFAGYTLLGDFVMQEAEDGPFEGAALQRLVRTQATLFDRLISAITKEHTGEWERRPNSSEERRLKRIEDLLGGEFVGGEEFDYDFELWHLGLIATGPGGTKAVRDLARELDCRLLLVCREPETVWAWLGVRREIDLDRLHLIVADCSPAGLLLAVGEMAQGLPGWRLTHRQAKASSSIAMRSRRGVVRYADVALLVSALGDEVFATSLRELFLAPLTEERDRGATLLTTLRAYFVAERNVSSAAAALHVSRQTVINRLNTVEERLGRSLGTCAPELETALRLEEFDHAGATPGEGAARLSSGSLQTVKATSIRLGTLPKRPVTSA